MSIERRKQQKRSQFLDLNGEVFRAPSKEDATQSKAMHGGSRHTAVPGPRPQSRAGKVMTEDANLTRLIWT